MKKYGKRIAAAAICAALTMTSLTGCGAKASDVVATMDGTELTLGEATFLLRYNQAMTQSYLGSLFGEDTNLFEQDLTGSGEAYGETLKSNILSTLKELVMLEQHMSDYGVEITEEDTAAIEEATQEFLAANSDDVLKEMMATEDTVSRMLTLYTIQARMEVAIEADADTEVSDEEAAEKTIQYAYFSIPETEEETEEESETGTDAAEEESESESTEEAVDETETEAVSETESEGAEETETVSETESESAEETETAGETETEAAEEESESESAEETEIVSETETEAASESDGEIASEDESDTEAADETESESETETEESAEKKETREQAQSVIDAVLAGETLEDAVAAVDEDKTVTDYSYGSDDETLVEVLKTAADTLSDGEIYAEPVETDNGFYVVQMVTTFDEEATEEHKLEIIDDRKDELYDTVLEGWEPENFEINDDVWDQVDFTDILTLMTEAETETETAADTEITSETDTEEASETEAASEADTEEASETESASETETEEASETESSSETDTEEVTETESTSETEEE